MRKTVGKILAGLSLLGLVLALAGCPVSVDSTKLKDGHDEPDFTFTRPGNQWPKPPVDPDDDGAK